MTPLSRGCGEVRDSHRKSFLLLFSKKKAVLAFERSAAGPVGIDEMLDARRDGRLALLAEAKTLRLVSRGLTGEEDHHIARHVFGLVRDMVGEG